MDDNCYIYLNEVKTHLPLGMAIILRGDVVHSGSEYAGAWCVDNYHFQHVLELANDCKEAEESEFY